MSEAFMPLEDMAFYPLQCQRRNLMSTQTQEFVRLASPQTHARCGPKFVGAVPGPKAKKIVAEDDLYLSPSYTRGYPLVVKRGYGCRIEDPDGNEFFDFTAGIAVTSTGHCHPEVVAAIQKQAGGEILISGAGVFFVCTGV